MNHNHKPDLSLFFEQTQKGHNNLFDDLIADNESEEGHWIPEDPNSQSQSKDIISKQKQDQVDEQDKALFLNNQSSNSLRSMGDPIQQPPQGYYTVEKIVAKKIENKQMFYKVKWLGYDSKLNTWEPIEHLKNVDGLIRQFEVKYCKNGATDTKKERKKAKKWSKSSNEDNKQIEKSVNIGEQKEVLSQQQLEKNTCKIQTQPKKQKQNISENLQKQLQIIQIEDSCSEQNILSTTITPIQSNKNKKQKQKKYQQIPNKKPINLKLNQAKRTDNTKLTIKTKIQSPKKSEKRQNIELCEKRQSAHVSEKKWGIQTTEKNQRHSLNENLQNPILLNIQRPKLCIGNINHYLVMGKQVKYQVDIENQKGNVVGVKLVSQNELKTHHSSKLRKFLQTYLKDVHRYEEDLEKFFELNPLQSLRNLEKQS